MHAQAREVSFQIEERDLFISRFRLASTYIMVPIMLAFGVVDLYFPWELMVAMFKARLLAIPVCFICTQLYRFRIIRTKYYFVPGYLEAAYLGCYMAYLVSLTGFETSPNYAGLNTVGIAAFSFFPWTWPHLTVSAALLYGPYIVALLIGHLEPLRISYLIPHLAFCVTTICIGTIINLSSRKVRRREFESRSTLRDEIAGKNRVIDKKTKEGIYLERLACQFSPQIIEGVKNGRLSLEGLARREVTSIFVDVESSTNRSLRLDQGDYTKILSEFFSSAITILLKHDVTVSNYLGDGLLAFTNAPEENQEHKIKAVQASLDLLRMHSNRKAYYLEKWRTHFNIRIGINSGWAFVGFFPSFRLGTYTAVGSSVNLASRLCSKSESNSILVTKSFLRDIGEELREVRVRHFETLTSIKGFEGETFELCSLEPRVAELQVGSEACPVCLNLLVEQNNLGDYRLLKCPSCGHSDLVSSRSVKVVA